MHDNLDNDATSINNSNRRRESSSSSSNSSSSSSNDTKKTIYICRKHQCEKRDSKSNYHDYFPNNNRILLIDSEIYVVPFYMNVEEYISERPPQNIIEELYIPSLQMAVNIDPVNSSLNVLSNIDEKERYKKARHNMTRKVKICYDTIMKFMSISKFQEKSNRLNEKAFREIDFPFLNPKYNLQNNKDSSSSKGDTEAPMLTVEIYSLPLYMDVQEYISTKQPHNEIDECYIPSMNIAINVDFIRNTFNVLSNVNKRRYSSPKCKMIGITEITRDIGMVFMNITMLQSEAEKVKNEVLEDVEAMLAPYINEYSLIPGEHLFEPLMEM